MLEDDDGSGYFPVSEPDILNKSDIVNLFSDSGRNLYCAIS